jgi:RimJ/RimL family protein N-acetyltransferase
MSGTQPTVKLKSPSNCTKEELSRFHEMVIAAGEVKAEGFRDRIERAEVLAFSRHGNEIIGVGALKRQHPNYTARIFKSANAKSAAGNFGLELGWVVIGEAHRRKGHSLPIVAALIAHAAGKPIYATSASTNEPMHKALIKYSFERDGGDWPSTERKNTSLRLFVRN